MAQVIAGIYEIEKKIGAGGGGIVYLGHHLRLDKQIVLKADKRTLSVGTEKLRREVDMLKDLSHTYIPQVYDFVQEDGVVYTVMDFIEGESLDKLLGRKQTASQPQVIKWACQLLEALNYLHARPPHGILHGDIKPANIMLRPNGDVCLIDFNIALALGEDGAVKVGFSRGYASPEHYGADYISSNRPAAVGNFAENKTHSKRAESDRTLGENDSDKTISDDDLDKTLADDDKTVSDAAVQGSSQQSTTESKNSIMLDVRSDIYSLGATLYHLLSGQRPAQNALEVIPLTEDVCSPAVGAIIQKAMSPDPAMRYQTAEEMLTAFLQLHKSDKRVIRHKRNMLISSAFLGLTFLVGGLSTFVGLKQLEQRQTALALAEYSANALAEGNVSEAVNLAMQAIPRGESIFEASVTAQAQSALTDALGVYDLSDSFKAYDSVELPSAPFDIAISPEGTQMAVLYAYEVAVYDMVSLQRTASLPTQNSALSDVIFTDENTIVYAGEQGVSRYDLRTQTVLWEGDIATTLAISADGSVVAAVNRDEDRAVIYRVSDGVKVTECSFDNLHMAVAANDIFADPGNYIFALNTDGSLLAVSFHNGGLIIFDLRNPDDSMIIYEESDYTRFSGGFCGDSFAFTAEKSGEALFGLIDIREAVYLGGYESQDDFRLQVDEHGIYLAQGNLLVRFDPTTLEETELAYTDSVNITGFSVGQKAILVSTDDNCFSFYDNGANLVSTESSNNNCDFLELEGEYAIVGNRNEPMVRLLRKENHSESQILSYDARVEHDEARISHDGKTAMLFGYQNLYIYDMEGNLMNQSNLPDADYIYDQQFVRKEDDSWLEVIWYDGTRRCYSAADGSMISEEKGKTPDKDLYEEFFVEGYRIASSLHAAPQVYDLKTDELVAELEKDSYLTYVTQVGEYLITEYINTEGERYGLLLNDKFEKLAYLPALCDVVDDRLVFDYESGDLRQCRLYSLQELIALGESYIN